MTTQGKHLFGNNQTQVIKIKMEQQCAEVQITTWFMEKCSAIAKFAFAHIATSMFYVHLLSWWMLICAYTNWNLCWRQLTFDFSCLFENRDMHVDYNKHLFKKYSAIAKFAFAYKPTSLCCVKLSSWWMSICTYTNWTLSQSQLSFHFSWLFENKDVHVDCNKH